MVVVVVVVIFVDVVVGFVARRGFVMRSFDFRIGGARSNSIKSNALPAEVVYISTVRFK